MSRCWRARAACRWWSASAPSSSTGTARRWSTATPAPWCSAPGRPSVRASTERRAALAAAPSAPPHISARAGVHGRRHADPRHGQCRRAGRRRARSTSATCDGVGLMRTEFLFSGAGAARRGRRSIRAYARVLEWAGGKPVTIRTVDAGGDKPVPGLPSTRRNPFLGLRGIRLSLARPEIFQGAAPRAGARGASHGNLKVMLPMVTVPARDRRRALLLDEALAELAGEGIAATPAAARHHGRGAGGRDRAGDSSPAAFFSIGSNDLTQYVTAAARDSSHVAELNDVRHPAVLRLIAAVAAFGARSRHGGQPVRRRRRAIRRICALLLRAGLRNLSVAPAALGRGQGGDRRHSPRSGRWRLTTTSPTMPIRPASRIQDDPAARARLAPSGTRQRLAAALGKNRSFVTQITSPAYATPIPARHRRSDLGDLPLLAGRARGLPRRLSARASEPAHRRARRPARCARTPSTCPISARRRRTGRWTRWSAISSRSSRI